MKILIADDSKTTRFWLTQMLKHLGHEVTET
jgi:CheY-like chemotaxis protein